MRIVTSLLLGLLTLALLSTACAPSSAVPGASLFGQAPTAQPAPGALNFPRGRFSAVSAPNMVVLAIENDGSFRIYLDDAMVGAGRFYPQGPQVVVDLVACAEESPQAAKPAAYNWVYDAEDGLAFLPVTPDPCMERSRYLAEQYQPKYLFIFNIPDRGVPQEWLW